MAGPHPHGLRVTGTGRVLVAPLGSTPPTGVERDWDAAWRDLGHTSADGVLFTDAGRPGRADGWRSVGPARFVCADRGLGLRFALMRTDAAVLALLVGATPPAPEGVMLGVEFAETDASGDTGPAKYRFVIPRGRIVRTTGATPARGSVLPWGVTFRALPAADAAPPATLLMNDRAYATV
ncbi:phage tail protein [Yinghuangia seranimata]|uniref:phage tail tube protein n=1 Tax=Yinghuangia seranimata TaxID=408067 RepID=UPI00248BC768|nr:phage tail protein [Yinghuangia seranimata]MDI2127413.1 phage tail protein [Yinghuangia seranimata]